MLAPRSISRLPLCNICCRPISQIQPKLPPTSSLIRQFSSRHVPFWPLAPRLSALATQRRHFRASRPRKDIFFLSIPAVKGFLLDATRAALVILPFFYRWRLSKRFPKSWKVLWSVPIFAICLVIAIGIDQSPRTARWRLLLMSEAEEMLWSQNRFETLIKEVAPKILPASDPRVETIKRICDRLVAAMDRDTLITAAAWPRDNDDISDRIRKFQERMTITPSASTDTRLLPFLPPTSNPEKILNAKEWDVFVIDEPIVNALVLPTKEIIIYTGLIDLLENDEPLLAAVLSHEVCHVSERHSVENMGALALTSVAFDIIRGVSWAFTISFPAVRDVLATCFNFLDQTVASRAYSRKLETEADTLGLQLLANAGYDPRAAQELWGFLNALEEDSKKPPKNAGEVYANKIMESAKGFLTTHPSGVERLANIERHLPSAIQTYKETKAKIAAQAKSKSPETSASSPILEHKDKMSVKSGQEKEKHSIVHHENAAK